MNIPSQVDLPAIFGRMMQSSLAGIPGVVKLTAGQPRMCVIITAFTHGNEPSGLAAFEYLIQQREKLKDVTLLLAVVNAEGAAQYFQSKTEEEKHACRAWGANLNRLPLDFPNNTAYPSVLQRVKDLAEHVFPEVTCGLDIHSMPQPIGGGLVIDVAGDRQRLDHVASVLPMHTRLRQMVPVGREHGSRTKPLSLLFGSPHSSPLILGMEADSHESPIGCAVAVKAAVSFLSALGAFHGDMRTEAHTQNVYDAIGAVNAPDTSYRVADPALLQPFVPVKASQVLLTSPTGDIRVRQDGRLIFGPPSVLLREADVRQEIFFLLSEPIVQHTSVVLPEWFTTD